MGTYSDLFKLKPRQKPAEAQPPDRSEVAVFHNEAKPLSTPPTVPDEQKVRLSESQIANNLTSENVRLLDFIHSYLEMKNAKLTGFRYPTPLIQKLEELEYELKVKSGKRVPKTTILVTAIAYLLWDYREKGDKSLLAEVIK